eukprot:SAG25_NODE_7316_length_488_cov_2.020566_1_plen_101_part_00
MASWRAGSPEEDPFVTGSGGLRQPWELQETGRGVSAHLVGRPPGAPASVRPSAVSGGSAGARERWTMHGPAPSSRVSGVNSFLLSPAYCIAGIGVRARCF